VYIYLEKIYTFEKD